MAIALTPMDSRWVGTKKALTANPISRQPIDMMKYWRISCRVGNCKTSLNKRNLEHCHHYIGFI